MKLNDREKKLIFIVVGVILIALSYFIGYRKISAANNKLDDKIEENRTLYNNLKEMQAREKQYLEDTEYYTSEYNTLLGSFDTGYSQEYSIMFVDQIEKDTGVWFSQVSLADTAALYTFGAITSSNPMTQGAAVYTSDYVGYGTTLTLSYKTSYAGYKELIEYLNTYKFKCRIDSVNATYNADDDEVSGSMILNIYAITGSDRKFLGAPVQNKFTGTENIFNSSTFTPGTNADEENGNNIVTDYDYYIALDSFKSDADSVVIGPKGDSAATRISKNSSEREKVIITFSGKEGKYTVSYAIGDTVYPATNYENGVEFTPGSMLSLLVVGTDRDPEGEDINGADATIINNTDMKLYVKIVDDDENPRFKIREKSGEVVVYE